MNTPARHTTHRTARAINALCFFLKVEVKLLSLLAKDTEPRILMTLNFMSLHY
jgi:hypothetical protein